MLTRENFFSTWAKPKEWKGKKGPKKTGEEMVVDEAFSQDQKGEIKTEEMMDVAEIATQNDRTNVAGSSLRFDGRGSRRVDLPIFAFQRKGIGARSSKPHYKPKEIKRKDQSTMF